MDKSVNIIAEIAQGFEGRPEQARLLLKAASCAGADAAKYQLVYADELSTPDYKYYDLFRSLEMPDLVWSGLAQYAHELGIELHLDIFGVRSLALAEKIGAKALKVHGTDIANVNLLNQIARSAVPKVLLGAGGAFLPEIEQAISLLHHKEVIILLGFQGYPTPNDSNQIARVRVLCDRFSGLRQKVVVGFADHAPPESPLRIALAACAYGAGARVFEKHLTLGEIMKMEDHEAALNPDRFSEFVAVLRDCAAAYGMSAKAHDFGMHKSEHGYRQMIRRHVVARCAISAGSHVRPEDVVLKRSSCECPVTDLSAVYGAVLKRDLASNEPFTYEDLQNQGDIA